MVAGWDDIEECGSLTSFDGTKTIDLERDHKVDLTEKSTDDAGKSLAADFDAQFEQTFRNIEKTLAEAGAKLSDMVTMTVFLIDARYTSRMTELRTELFGKDFPASAAITVQGFAQPEMMIEVQGIAVTA